jgi:hypothetical protein
MKNGRNLSIAEAIGIIKTFEQQETARTPIDKLAIGQKLDLDVLNNFLDEIKKHPQAADIDAIRIYIGKSTRAGQNVETHNLIFVPVLKDNKDLHKVYTKDDVRSAVPTILGDTLPCPNVCPDGESFYC